MVIDKHFDPERTETQSEAMIGKQHRERFNSDVVYGIVELAQTILKKYPSGYT